MVLWCEFGRLHKFVPDLKIKLNGLSFDEHYFINQSTINNEVNYLTLQYDSKLVYNLNKYFHRHRKSNPEHSDLNIGPQAT